MTEDWHTALARLSDIPGPTAIARHLGVHVRTVRFWAQATREPSAAHKREMVRLAGLTVSQLAEEGLLRRRPGRKPSGTETAIAADSLCPPGGHRIEGDMKLTRIEDADPSAIVIGIEVSATHPAYGRCAMVLDPQHGGGVHGFGRHPGWVPEGRCAAAVAAEIVCGGPSEYSEGPWQAPPRVQYYSPRWDADAVAAVAILDGRVPRPMLPGSAALAELERLDHPVWPRGSWRPRELPEPVTVEESPLWGAVQALAMGAAGVPMQGIPQVSLATAIEAAAAVICGARDWQDAAEPGDVSDPVSDALAAAHRTLRDGADYMAQWVRHHVKVRGPIACIDAYSRGPVMSAAYAIAPVVVATHPGFAFGRAPNAPRGRKHTVAISPRAPQSMHDALRRILARLQSLEPGWGGNVATGIIGSPMTGPSSLGHEQVSVIVANEIGDGGAP